VGGVLLKLTGGAGGGEPFCQKQQKELGPLEGSSEEIGA